MKVIQNKGNNFLNYKQITEYEIKLLCCQFCIGCNSLILSSDCAFKVSVPAAVHQKIIKQLNVESALWRAVAGCMSLSACEVDTLREGKMNGLFERMTQQNMCVRDLVGFLTNKDVDRIDVIQELKVAGIVNDDHMSSFADVESSDPNDSTKENSGL